MENSNEIGVLINTEKKDSRRYKYFFTTDEVLELKDGMLQSMSEKNHLENEKKQVMSDFKEKIEFKELEITDKHTKLSRGFEYRDKQVSISLDFQRKVRVLFDETGEVFGEEPLLPEDYQLKMKLDEQAEKEASLEQNVDLSGEEKEEDF